MQVCTVVSRKTVPIASGNPFSPSTTAIRTLPTPRVLSSFITLSQNLAPSVCSIHSPRTSFSPSLVEGERDVDSRVAHQALAANLDPQRVEENHRIDRI
jgi:hypothetical protein